VAAKHGLAGLTKAVALETAGQRITCNGICPGWVASQFNYGKGGEYELYASEHHISIDEASHKLLNAKQPSGTFVQPDHIGNLTVFLCSDAASQITGVLLPIDGGWTAQ
jgi:3-hydroxybutyrate dehydrogenase